MQRALNQIEMQGHSDEQNDFPLHQPAAQVEIPVTDIHQVQPEKEPVVDNLMNISAAAYSGCPSDSTISLLLHFPHSTTIALADTGSTNTFMDYQFALKHNIPLTQTRQRSVKVAGGGILSSEFMAYNCLFSVQGHKF
jgi:hypothetical protein